MAKLAILAAMFALSFVIATASVTITTVEVNEESGNPTHVQQCRQRVQGQQLKSCRSYLTQGCECEYRSQGKECECRSSTGIAMRGQGSRCRMQLKECCNELEKMEEQCMCEGIKQIVHKMQQEPYTQSEEMHQMVTEAKKLPQVCGFTQSPCTIRSVWF